MRELKRNMSIVMKPVSKTTYRVEDNEGNERLNPSDDFNIYFRNVEYSEDGQVKAIYLGETDDFLIDGFCRAVHFNELAGWRNEDGDRVSSARLASVKNGEGMIIINK